MSATPLLSVRLADLERDDRHLEQELPVAWLHAALAGTEAVPQDTPGTVSLDVRKQGREIMVTGRARAAIVMPCARTLDPVPLTVEAEIFLILAPAPPTQKDETTGARRRRRDRTPRQADRDAQREAEESLLTPEEAAQDTYAGEEITLDAFVREHILLELPAFPLREDLRSEDSPAIRPPSAEASDSYTESIDPRLAPLAEMARRLKREKE